MTVSDCVRTAAEAGWHLSRYNLMIPNPDAEGCLIANVYRRSCVACTPLECCLLSMLDELDEAHPIIRHFASRGVITRIDERALLEARARLAAARHGVSMTVCPTMGCNFDCPYCFENHRAGKMSLQVQDDVVALADRLLKAAKAERLNIHWFGGEPLMALDVIESLSERLRAVAAEHGAEYSAGIITNGYLLSQDAADVLGRASVKKAQITLDGLRDVHDATRHLAGGAPTFDRITENLRTVKLPFRVSIRHNVRADNMQEIPPLMDFVEKLSQESGNDLTCYPAVVRGNANADSRGSQVELLCDSSAGEIEAGKDTQIIGRRPHFCGANTLYTIGVDDKGNLQKCWEDVDKPERSFGRASVWDPARPFQTADHPDKLTCYLNATLPLNDPECRECVWLPACLGGCPNRRLYAQRVCAAYKNEPEKYVMALYRQNAEKSNRK